MAGYKDRPCVRCGKVVRISGDRRKRQVRNGEAIYCEEPLCSRRARRRGMVSQDRRMGCTVTAVLPGGETIVRTAAGKTIDALRTITDLLPSGSYVASVSTHRTILADLTVGTRHDRFGEPDPWNVERTLLGRIGRLDLLDPRARLRKRVLRG